MVEIVFIFLFAKKITAIVEAKGYKSAKYRLIFAGLWLGGEILGFVFGLLLFKATYNSPSYYLAYLAGLAMAAGGAAIAWKIAKDAPVIAPTPSSTSG